ncbi:MAG: ATP-binding protein [Sphingobium sp.]
MRPVFTLWPTDEAASPDRRVDEQGVPIWASRPGPVPARNHWTRQDRSVLAIVACLAVALALVVPGDVPGSILAGILIVAMLALAALGIVMYRSQVTRLQRDLEESRRWSDILFERGGIALWREDWTYARDAVLRLMQAGVTDMQTYFATHTEELREIRRNVTIKDVNGFAVIRTKVAEKAQLRGSLERILPDTDHSFIQWLVAFARGDSFYRSETHITRPDGSPFGTLFAAGLPTDMRGFEDILVSDLDITEYKTMQARLTQAESDIARAVRISTMGALTASIAHEVNSPLAAIVSNAEASLRWLRRDKPDLEEAGAALEAVITAAIRARDVVERTRAFLANAPAQFEPRDIAGLIRESIQLIDRELRAARISVHIDAEQGLPPVLADGVNIQQVLVNLMMNAAQAMGGLDGPRDLTIAARQDGDRVRVEISDQGPGIPESNMHLIFEPFYSTREGGMGMGLAICKTCIAAHGGRLWATSVPEAGATFHFDLPAASSPTN